MIPRVSFITAVKDRSAELKEMLQSLIKQDMKEWEAIIVDDHSSEPIKDVVGIFDEPRFRYYQLPQNLTGVSNARNFAIDHAESDIMITADGDDINWPARAKVIDEFMTKTQCDVFYSHIITYFTEGDKRYDFYYQPFNADLFKMVNFITNPGTAFRKSMFLQVGGFDPEFSLSEDYDLYLRMLNANAKFFSYKFILAEYRIGNQNTTIQKKELMHDFIQKTRIKNNLPVVNLDEITKYAEKEVADSFLSQRQVWHDDRYKG